MNITGITANYTSNAQNTNLNRNTAPAFKGALGDKFVREITKGGSVETKEIMEAVKGTFGLKSEKVSDVIDSLLGKIQSLMRENADKTNRIDEQTHRAKQEMELLRSQTRKEIQETEERCQNSLRAKDNQLAAKDEEVRTAKELAAKYEPMAKVKSIEETGVVMPNDVLRVLNEMVENREKSIGSTVEYLMTGKGQEEALAQLNRSAVIQKAYREGIMGIAEIYEAANSIAREYGLRAGDPRCTLLRMIENGLCWDSKGSYLSSPVVRQQVKTNAMGLLTPLCDEKYCNTNVGSTEKELEEIFDRVIKFQDGLKKGRVKLVKRYPGQELKEEIVPYDFNKSKIIARETYNGKEYECPYTYFQISDWGNSNYR